VTTCLEKLEMLGNLTAVTGMSGIDRRSGKLQGQNLVRENCLLLTSRLGVWVGVALMSFWSDRLSTLWSQSIKNKTDRMIMNLIAKLGIIYATACHAILCTTALDYVSVRCHCCCTALTSIYKHGTGRGRWGLASHCSSSWRSGSVQSVVLAATNC